MMASGCGERTSMRCDMECALMSVIEFEEAATARAQGVEVIGPEACDGVFETDSVAGD
jgi:hypothetical protein